MPGPGFMSKKHKNFIDKYKFEISEDERELFLNAYYQGSIPKIKDEVCEIKNPPKKIKTDNFNDEDEELFKKAFAKGHIENKDSKPKVDNRKSTKRRKKEVDARLDLHGLTSQEAEKKVFNFIYKCKQKGLRTVLVIHGKGSGVLMTLVYSIAQSHPHIEDYQSAYSKLGGSGALIIKIKK